eukprot:681620-Prymnesium_polylepis.1
MMRWLRPRAHGAPNGMSQALSVVTTTGIDVGAVRRAQNASSGASESLDKSRREKSKRASKRQPSGELLATGVPSDVEPEWNVQEWLGSLDDLTNVLAEAILEPLGGAKASSAEQPVTAVQSAECGP